jgi:hypothetical protein
LAHLELLIQTTIRNLEITILNLEITTHLEQIHNLENKVLELTTPLDLDTNLLNQELTTILPQEVLTLVAEEVEILAEAAVALAAEEVAEAEADAEDN